MLGNCWQCGGGAAGAIAAAAVLTVLALAN